MNFIDITLLVLIFVGAYFGYKKGLLIEVLSFFALIIAIVSGLKLMHTAVEYFTPQTENEKSLFPFLAFLVIFVLVFFGIFLLGKFLKKILDLTLLGSFDNWAGALFGALKTAFGLSLLLWLSHYAQVGLPASLEEDSFIYPQLISFAPKTVAYISYVIPFQDIFPLIEKTLQGK